MKITQRDKKFLIAGVIAVVIFSLLKFVILPAWDKLSSHKEELALKEMTLEKYIRFIGKQGELQRKLKLLKRKSPVSLHDIS